MNARLLKRTPLHAAHLAAGARMVDFGGWDMPLHFGSQIEEHHAVRRQAGAFDVSHMRVLDVAGAGSRPLLRGLLSADVDRRSPGQALYSCLLNDAGGVLDDLIVYRSEDGPVQYRAILNAATADRDIGWIAQHAERGPQDPQGPPAVDLASRDDLAILALQGPQALAVLFRAQPTLGVAAAGLKTFHCTREGALFVARTGYTGEDGFEIVLPAGQAQGLWERLLDGGARACGLGARDTLRLEAGMSLYGQDLEETISPLESGVAHAVDLSPDRPFIGRAALERQRAAGGLRQWLGLVLLERGVLRAHQAVHTAHGEGQVTSGTYSPTLQVAIGLARLPPQVAVGDRVEVRLRDRPATAKVVMPRFVRHGKPLVSLN